MIDISNDFYIDDGYIVKRQKNRKGEVSDKIICNRVEVVKKLFYPETKQGYIIYPCTFPAFQALFAYHRYNLYFCRMPQALHLLFHIHLS